jgi:DNA-binding response OmpR family regulator
MQKNIMIIDDDEEDAMILYDVIQEIAPGSKCSISNSYQSAKAILDEEVAPDFIFLDALMYPIGGKETLVLLGRMEKLSNTIIVMNSGLITESLANEFSDLGADRILQKAPDYNSLFSSVKEILSIAT